MLPGRGRAERQAMQAIKCEVCGSTDLIKKDGVFVCRYCGMQYSLPEVQKMLCTVKIDKTEERNNYFILARRFFAGTNYADALKYYDLALREDPQNWEAIYLYAVTSVATQDCNYLYRNLESIINMSKVYLRQIATDTPEENQMVDVNLFIDAHTLFIRKGTAGRTCGNRRIITMPSATARSMYTVRCGNCSAASRSALSGMRSFCWK